MEKNFCRLGIFFLSLKIIFSGLDYFKSQALKNGKPQLDIFQGKVNVSYIQTRETRFPRQMSQKPERTRPKKRNKSP